MNRRTLTSRSPVAPPNSCLRRDALWAWVVGATICGLALPIWGEEGTPLEKSVAVRFDRDIQPLLSDKCFRCHGPDAKTRQAELRLDELSQLLTDPAQQIIAPGRASASELVHRLVAEDADTRMPPEDSGQRLTEKEIELLTRWIDEGAHHQSHWSFVAPKAPELPNVQGEGWIRNPIDHFVLSRLDQQGWQPAPEADRRTLIRRVTLDLTGLPPTLREVDEFLADSSEDAYQQVVERLLMSPRCGERLALDWLDAARYADTHGYLFDTERTMWRWRDWVIEAFNRNMPFDQFTVEQLAGDLLPDSTISQQIATGFNRNHIINNEAGATPEEYFAENIIDRINTTSTVWMGLTMACAQCHDHKYDPISQRDYYQLYAFFNNVPETGLDGFNSNASPLIAAPTRADQQKLEELDRQISATEQELAPVDALIESAQQQWEADFFQPPSPVDGLVVDLPFDAHLKDSLHPSAEAEFKEGMPNFETGLFGQAVALDGQRYVELGNRADFDRNDAFSLSAWIYPTNIKGRRAIFSRMELPEVSFRGYSLQIIDGAAALFLVNSFPDNLLTIQAKNAIEPYQWHHILATYDGQSKADGIQLYVDGQLQEIGIKIDTLSESIRTEKFLQVGNGHPGAKFVGRIDEARIYDRVLSPDEIANLPGLTIHSLLAVDAAARNDEQRQRIRNYYLETAAPSVWREPYARLIELRKQKKAAERQLPTSMVMKELGEPRQTQMLIRGAYDALGDSVTAATPAFLPPMAGELPRNRLGLARWLINGEHPLTARVTVNRYWQMMFGVGLVSTAENFGLQGDAPSHPELLDWLAVEFVRSGWDIKALLKLMVSSATYRQSSQASQERWELDPQNRLLGRGPRHRLSAEAIRDQALSISGLLSSAVGGPSVKPYQPADLWREVAFDVTGQVLTAQVYQQDTGESLYRRSMYTFWKRTAPPPTMLIFDSPDRERCVVQRECTNTPLQALVLMNDPTFVEASRKLAERMLDEAGPSPIERIARGFQLTLSRFPSEAELQPLQKLLQEQMARFATDGEGAQGLLSVGESAASSNWMAAELAAYTIVASVLLNLDETLTKG